MTTGDTRQHVHTLIDQLPQTQLTALAALLESMIDSVAPLNGHKSDEEFTEDEAEGVQRSEEWFRHNKGIPMEEVMAEFGLSQQDFPLAKHGQ